MKKVVGFALVSALLAPMVLAPMAADAAQPPVVGKGKVDFKLDPDETKHLYVKDVSDFYFEKLVIAGDTQVYFGTYSEHLKDGNTGEFLAPSATVVDNRGSLAGWHLNVKMSEFVDTAGKADPLKAAELSMKATRGDSVTPGAIIENTDLPKDLVTIGTADKTVLSVPKDKGYGTQTYHFGADSATATDLTKGFEAMNLQSNPDVTLKIPGEVKKDATVTYEADLTWTLTDAPSN